MPIQLNVFARRCLTRCMAMGCVLFAGGRQTTAAAQGMERQAPVEVTIPKPPTPVMGAGQRLLVYELHVTNFGTRLMVLRSVEVFGGDMAAAPLATLRDSSLRASFQGVGRMSMMSPPASRASNDQLQLDPGQRAVVFMWIALDPTRRAPASLRHRLTFSTIDTAGQGAYTSSPVIDSLSTPVLPEADAARIAAPIDGGDWLAGEGPSNDSPHRRSLVPFNGKAWISQRFAIDFVKIGSNGNTWHDDRSRNENFWGYGEPILAVADGEVADVVDSIPENAPDHLPRVNLATLSGNHVILRFGQARYALYAHLKRGSVRVRRGQRVRCGEVLGLLGNSGQATAPHLHFQLMDAPSDLGAEGIPFVFDRYDFLGPGNEYEQDKHPTMPTRAQLPIGDAVVRFPTNIGHRP